MRFLAFALLAGCATTSSPYRFDSPLLAGARASFDPPSARPPEKPTIERDVLLDARAAIVVADRVNAVAAESTPPAADPLPPEELPPPVELTTLPAPHQEPERVLPHAAMPGDLRAMTGARTRHDPHAFAILSASALTERDGPDGIATDGEYLLAWAQSHAFALAPTEATTGDLLVFDRTAGTSPASLWAVVLARDDRGVLEMLYVADGVIRRGFVDPSHPLIGRGPDRAIHNTFLRHSTHWPPPGTRFLAGELLSHVFRMR